MSLNKVNVLISHVPLIASHKRMELAVCKLLKGVGQVEFLSESAP